MNARAIRPASRLAVTLWPLFAACGNDVSPSADGAIADTGHPDATVLDAALSDAAQDGDSGPMDASLLDGDSPDLGERFLTRLESPDDFDRLQGTKGHVKYLAPTRSATRTPPLLEDCYFQNMEETEWHLFFLHGFPELATLTNQEYVSFVLRRSTRRWWGGGLERRPGPHPITGASMVLAYTIYAETDLASRLVEADVVEVDGILRSCVPFGAQLLAFMPGDTEQIRLAQQIEAALRARGIAVVFP